MRSRTSAAFVVLMASFVAGCGLMGSPAPTRDASCNGIGAAVGGCDPDRPTFVADTCAGIGREFGQQVDARLLSIYTGPESREESKAVRASHYVSIAASLANARVRELGLVRECDAAEFMASAEQEFSGDFRAHAGELLHDGDPVTYAEWREATLAMLSILDREEGPSG